MVLHVLQTTQNWSFHVVVLQRTAKKCTKIYNARAQPLFCSLNLLFSDVAVAVVVVVILNSLISKQKTVRFLLEELCLAVKGFIGLLVGTRARGLHPQGVLICG